MVLAQFIPVIPLHALECQVNAALPARCTINILQFVIHLTKLCNLTVNTSGDVKKCDWNCSVGAKAKNRSNLVVMHPPVVESLLNIQISGCLEI
jgi:hypothetical protein